eukprot:977057-Rhodomonas_salina.2
MSFVQFCATSICSAHAILHRPELSALAARPCPARFWAPAVLQLAIDPSTSTQEEAASGSELLPRCQ